MLPVFEDLLFSRGFSGRFSCTNCVGAAAIQAFLSYSPSHGISPHRLVVVLLRPHYPPAHHGLLWTVSGMLAADTFHPSTASRRSRASIAVVKRAFSWRLSRGNSEK